MKDQKQNRNLSVGIVAGVCALAVAVGGGIAFLSNSKSPTQQSSGTFNPETNSSTQKLPDSTLPTKLPNVVKSPDSKKFPSAIQPETEAVTQKTVELYWVKDNPAGEIDLVSSAFTLEAPDEPEAVLKVAFNRLLAGPTDEMAFSAIPEGTKLQALTVENNGIYIDLSEEFTSGGGSASMISRLGQVIYTASSLKPDAKVWIFVGGKPLEILGGEGLEVSQPTTRDNFQQEYQF
ncbi:MAG: GerMN domain-containing protein [Microcoleaceae cyanobacterium]